MTLLRPHVNRASRRSVPAIGVEVGAAWVRAVVLRTGTVVWADARPWTADASAALTDAPSGDAPSLEGWSPEAASLETVLTSLLTDARDAAQRAAGRWRGRAQSGRLPTFVALAPRFAQLKRLTGLPVTPDAQTATEYVHEHAGSLFLRNGTPIVTGGVRAVTPDHREMWAGAYHSPIVADVVWACTRAGTRFAGLASVAAVLGHALVPERTRPSDTSATGGRAGGADDERPGADVTRAPDLAWSDEDIVLDLWFAPDERVADVRRTPRALCEPGATSMRSGSKADGVPNITDTGPQRSAAPPWHAALATSDHECAAFAAAFGAARVAAHEATRDPASLAFTARGTRAIVRARRAALVDRSSPARPVPRWRLVMAALVCAVGLAAAAAAPGLRATRDAQRAAAALRTLGPQRVAAAAAAADLIQSTEMLRALAPADGGRPSPVRVLAVIARVLPRGAALVDVQLDRGEGRVVVLAPHAAAVVAALARVPMLGGIEVVGPVTRDEAPAPPSVGVPFPGMAPPTAPTLPRDTASGPRASERVALRFRVLAPGPDAVATKAVAPGASMLGTPTVGTSAAEIPVGRVTASVGRPAVRE